MAATPLIIVTGPPASGKTGLARRFAADLRLPLICRDDFKEKLFDTLGWSDRAWSKRLGLLTWDKPQTPCLSSRLPYGTPVTRERLAMVDRAEQAVRAAGIRIFRVRHHEAANGDAIARLEVSADELPAMLDPTCRAQVQRGVIAAGYKFVALDLEPFRSGRLNEAAGLVRLGAKPAA